MPAIGRHAFTRGITNAYAQANNRGILIVRSSSACNATPMTGRKEVHADYHGHVPEMTHVKFLYKEHGAQNVLSADFCAS